MKIKILITYNLSKEILKNNGFSSIITPKIGDVAPACPQPPTNNSDSASPIHNHQKDPNDSAPACPQSLTHNSDSTPPMYNHLKE